MGADDASSADMRRSPANPDADPLALDDETVERLLAGELSPAQAPPGYAEVAALLAATAAPPTPDELAGQAAALAELRAATRPRRAVVGFGRAARPPRRRRVGLVAAALVGALAAGGAAAAATGNLPAPVRQVARSILGSVDGAAPAAPPTRPGVQPAPGSTPGSAGATSGPQGPRPTAAAGHGPGSSAAGTAPGQDRHGLCEAYQAGKGAEPGGKLDAAAFQALAELAGGRDKIAPYCERLLAGGDKPKKDKQQPPPDDPGQGQGGGAGQPQQGPPVTTGADGQGQRAPGTSPSGR
jgi:hypothetical protein